MTARRAAAPAAALDVRQVVGELAPAALVEARRDGGWRIELGGRTAGVAPQQHPEALRRCVEDAIAALRLMTAPPAPAPASVEQRLAELERRVAELEACARTSNPIARAT